MTGSRGLASEKTVIEADRELQPVHGKGADSAIKKENNGPICIVDRLLPLKEGTVAATPPIRAISLSNLTERNLHDTLAIVDGPLFPPRSLEPNN